MEKGKKLAVAFRLPLRESEYALHDQDNRKELLIVLEENYRWAAF
jgi:hypothetical protein